MDADNLMSELAARLASQRREPEVGGLQLNFIAKLVAKEIPGATREQCLAAARQIMFQLNIKEVELI